MGVVLQHFAGDVPRNSHNGLLTSVRLGQFSYRMVSEIVKTKVLQASGSPQRPPRRSPTLLRNRRINFPIFASRKKVMVWLCDAHLLRPMVQLQDCFPSFLVQWNHSPTSIGLALANCDHAFHEINVQPLKPLNFARTHRGIQS
jgi:hypothetical protein